MNNRSSYTGRFLYTAIFAVLSLCLIVDTSPVSADDFETWTYFTGTGAATAMKADGDIVWCGTAFGLVQWDTRDMSYSIYRVPDGLPHAHIKDLDIAPNGDVWVATEKGGIARYDGSSWETHSMENGLPADKCLSLEIDADGMVWASVYTAGYYDFGEGLAWWDGVSWQSSKYDNQIWENEKNMVTDIACSPNGMVWTKSIGGNYVASFLDSEWTFIQGRSAKYIMTGSDGTLWMLNDGALFRYAGESFEAIDLPYGFGAGYLIEPVAGSDGELWIVTYNGRVMKIENGTSHVVYDKSGLKSQLKAFTVGDDGILYGGTGDGSLAVFDGTGWTVFPQETKMGVAEFYSIIEDRDGVLWSTGETGICKYNGESWNIAFSYEELPGSNQYSYSLLFDSENVPWVFRNHRMYYNSNGEWMQLSALRNFEIGSVIMGNDSDIWLVMRDTEYPKEVKCYDAENDIMTGILLPDKYYEHGNPNISLVQVDESGALWLTSGYHLLGYRRGIWEESRLLGETFVIGSDGSLWGAAIDDYEGHGCNLRSSLYVKRPDSDTVTRLMSGNEAYYLRDVDQSNRAWMSSHVCDAQEFGYDPNGVIRYDGTTSARYTELNGLPSNTVYDIYADRNNAIWFATDKGLCRYGDISTGVDEEEAPPSPIPLIMANPNPFNPMTTVSFTLPEEGLTTMTVYNIAGQKVATLVSDVMTPGAHHVVWDGRDTSGSAVASGVYIARLVSGKHTASAKLALVR